MWFLIDSRPLVKLHSRRVELNQVPNLKLVKMQSIQMFAHHWIINWIDFLLRWKEPWNFVLHNSNNFCKTLNAFFFFFFSVSLDTMDQESQHFCTLTWQLAKWPGWPLPAEHMIGHSCACFLAWLHQDRALSHWVEQCALGRKLMTFPLWFQKRKEKKKTIFFLWVVSAQCQ